MLSGDIHAPRKLHDAGHDDDSTPHKHTEKHSLKRTMKVNGIVESIAATKQ